MIIATLYRSHKNAFLRFFKKFFIRRSDISSPDKASSRSENFPINFMVNGRMADKVEVTICLFISGSLKCFNVLIVSAESISSI